VSTEVDWAIGNAFYKFSVTGRFSPTLNHGLINLPTGWLDVR
jgi:hypothetical protein